MGLKDFFTQDANEMTDRQAEAYLRIFNERPWLWVAIQIACGVIGAWVLWIAFNGLVAVIGAAVMGWFIVMYALGRLWRRRASR